MYDREANLSRDDYQFGRLVLFSNSTYLNYIYFVKILGTGNDDHLSDTILRSLSIYIKSYIRNELLQLQFDTQITHATGAYIDYVFNFLEIDEQIEQRLFTLFHDIYFQNEEPINE